MVLVQAFTQPQTGSVKGLCLRLATKWVVTTVCGGSTSYIFSAEEWLAVKKKKHGELEHGSKGYKQYEDYRSKHFSFIPNLQNYPIMGVDAVRWQSTVAKQQAYVKKSEEVEKGHGDVDTVDNTFIMEWATRIAQRHGQDVTMGLVDLASQGGWLAIGLAKAVLPSQGGLVICCDFANSKAQGGHALGWFDPFLFDPSGGLYKAEHETVGFRIVEVDQFIFAKYGRPEQVKCYVVSRT